MCDYVLFADTKENLSCDLETYSQIENKNYCYFHYHTKLIQQFKEGYKRYQDNVRLEGISHLHVIDDKTSQSIPFIVLQENKINEYKEKLSQYNNTFYYYFHELFKKGKDSVASDGLIVCQGFTFPILKDLKIRKDKVSLSTFLVSCDRRMKVNINNIYFVDCSKFDKTIDFSKDFNELLPIKEFKYNNSFDNIDSEIFDTKYTILLENINFNQGVNIESLHNIEFDNCAFNGHTTIGHDRIFKYYAKGVNSVTIKNSGFFGSFIIIARKLSMENTIMDIKDGKREVTYEIIVPFQNITLSNGIEDRPIFQLANNKPVPVMIFDTPDLLTIESKSKGLFNRVDMRKLIFMGNYTDDHKNELNNPNNINKINILNCKFNDGHKLSEADMNRERLEYSYLYLRESYDKRGEYIAGNDFHYNYYEIKRKHDANLSYWDKFFLTLYGYLNGYNTKPERAVIWLFMVIIIATIALFYVNGFSFEKIGITDKVQKSIAAGILGLVPLKSLEMIKFDNLWSFLIILTENILSPILIALFTLALRNRFRRDKKEEK